MTNEPFVVCALNKAPHSKDCHTLQDGKLCINPRPVEASAPAPPSAREPYFVEVDQNGCGKCGAGRMYTVVGPDGDSLGESWGGEDGESHASDIADWMNMAFEAGKESRTAAPDDAVRLVDRMTCQGCKLGIPFTDGRHTGQEKTTPIGRWIETSVCTAQGREIIAALAEKGLLR